MTADVKRQAARELVWLGRQFKGVLELADQLSEAADLEKVLTEQRDTLAAEVERLEVAETQLRGVDKQLAEREAKLASVTAELNKVMARLK